MNIAVAGLFSTILGLPACPAPKSTGNAAPAAPPSGAGPTADPRPLPPQGLPHPREPAAAGAGLDPADAGSVAIHMTLADALLSRRRLFAVKVVAARAIVAGFAARHRWSLYLRKPLFKSVEIFATQAALWRRILELNELPPTTRLTATGLAAGIEKSILLAVTPEEYKRLRPEYAAAPGAWTRLLAHEMAHRLHVAILRGNEDAMGPRWFYEGFAVVVSGDLKSGPLPPARFWAATAARGRGAYRKYATALRLLMTRIPLATLVLRAGKPGFEKYLQKTFPALPPPPAR